MDNEIAFIQTAKIIGVVIALNIINKINYTIHCGPWFGSHVLTKVKSF
jgi:hypothetical protein